MIRTGGYLLVLPEKPALNTTSGHASEDRIRDDLQIWLIFAVLVSV
jgi:hypothetical protein